MWSVRGAKARKAPKVRSLPIRLRHTTRRGRRPGRIEGKMPLFKIVLVAALLWAAGGSFGLASSQSVRPAARDPRVGRDSASSADRIRSGFKYAVDLSDAKQLLTAEERSGLESNLRAALDFWGQVVRGTGTVDVHVRVGDTTSSGRFQGRCNNMMPKRTLRGQTVGECASVYELRTGQDPNGASPDVTIELPADYLRANFWIDPSPEKRMVPVPSDKGDLVSVLAHEVGHGLGFGGFIDSRTMTFPSNKYISLFDSFVQIAGKTATFSGPNALAANGGYPVDLCYGMICRYGDLYHLRRDAYPDRLRQPYVYGLMSGEHIHRGMRYRLAPVEIGMLKDLGLTVN
jgi:hypothetical protein